MAGGLIDLCVVGEGLTCECFSPEDPPPRFLQVESACPDRDEGVFDPGVALEPFSGGFAGVTGKVVGNQVDVAGGVGLFDQLEESLSSRCCASWR